MMNEINKTKTRGLLQIFFFTMLSLFVFNYLTRMITSYIFNFLAQVFTFTSVIGTLMMSLLYLKGVERNWFGFTCLFTSSIVFFYYLIGVILFVVSII